MRSARVVAISILLGIQTGCGGGSITGSSPPVTQAPASLTYSLNPAVCTKGVAIANDTPTSAGGAVRSYSVSPPLPAGLSLDASTGVVSGTPTAIVAESTYMVTATNAGGSTSVGLVIAVNDLAPDGLAYASNPAVYTKGVAIATDTPSIAGGAVVAYSVWPALPAGLSLDTSTGVISGRTDRRHCAGDLHSDREQLRRLLRRRFGHSREGRQRGGNERRRCRRLIPHLCAGERRRPVLGQNSHGELGNSSTTESSAPVQVQGLVGGVQAVAAGGSQACALVDGGVQCWGSNSHGELGNSSTSDSSVPVQVQGLASGVQAVAAGGSHLRARERRRPVLGEQRQRSAREQLHHRQLGARPGPGPCERRAGRRRGRLTCLRARERRRPVLGVQRQRPAREQLHHRQFRARPGPGPCERGAGHRGRRHHIPARSSTAASSAGGSTATASSGTTPPPTATCPSRSRASRAGCRPSPQAATTPARL